MIAQLVGAGALIKLLLGIEYTTSVLIVGTLMTVYVIFGGMTATSWVQIVKAVLLMAGTFIISVIVFAKFNFSVTEMFAQMKTATPLKDSFLNPGVKYKDGLDTLSLNLGLVLGTAGLPHILVRFLQYVMQNSTSICRIRYVVNWRILYYDNFLRIWGSGVCRE